MGTPDLAPKFFWSQKNPDGGVITSYNPLKPDLPRQAVPQVPKIAPTWQPV